jgi:hypothetical protein
MAKFLNLSIDIAADMFLTFGDWRDVRRLSRMNANAIAAERRRYQAIASEGVR